MAKVLMVQGTMSGAGKSLIVAALCRIMNDDGWRVSPFKSQNMALNSFVTDEGFEMGRAQVLQADAARVKPDVNMNPILLKPTGHSSSQVIVGGVSRGNMSAREYFAYKKSLIPDIKKSFKALSEKSDIIVIEGAGSPAEINLKENDIVNMGMAALVNAPVLLVGDIDRGGVFAQLLGTLMLLTEEEKARVEGLIINKFRGDISLLGDGPKMLEEKGGVPVVGTVPYMDLTLDEEDSQSAKLNSMYASGGKAAASGGGIRIAVIGFPHISNYTDMQVFEQSGDVTVSYVTSPEELTDADMIILPGSKNTIYDLGWMRERGIERAVLDSAGRIPVFGICGGFQMLGERINDPDNTESGGSIDGLSLLPFTTTLLPDKTQKQVTGKIGAVRGIFAGLSGHEAKGYEIHMGVSKVSGKGDDVTDGDILVCDGAKDVYGTYLHGIFDKGDIATEIIRALALKKSGKGADVGALCDLDLFRDRELDRLAGTVREYLDMERIYGMLREADI